MNNMLGNMEEILENQVCGLHQYILSEPCHLCYASKNLCDMLGVGKEELLCVNKDLYAETVHIADRKKYSEFIEKLKKTKQTLTSEYRLTKKDGSVIWVRDTCYVMRDEQGNTVATSALTDITDIINDNKDLHFLNETIPCGFLKCTCEKQPGLHISINI